MKNFRSFFAKSRRRFGMASSPAIIFGLAASFTLACATACLAQNINATVAPNSDGSDNFVDIQNTTGSNWYFFSDPAPSAATMARVDESGLSVYTWPDVGNFEPDPDNSLNRIYYTEFLRVYPNTLTAGKVIRIEYASSPEGTHYIFNITVTGGAQVVSIEPLDLNPTSAAIVHWGVTFDHPISDVTTTNFALDNPDDIAGVAITSVTPDSNEPSATWTVAASTGAGTGLLGLNWVGSFTEQPPVPNSFVGEDYSFSLAPVIDEQPSNFWINVNSTATLSVGASLRGGGMISYQWFSGQYGAATSINGATDSRYKPSKFLDTGSFPFFCRVFATSNDYTDSSIATITVGDPPNVSSSPQDTFVAAGQKATFTVTATGTSLDYQWYSGVEPDTNNPVGDNSASFTTPPLATNQSFWVRVSNPGPTIADSSTASATVIASLMAAAAGYSGAVNAAFPDAFAVTVQDAQSNLVAGVPVTFTVHGGAATGFFPGDSSTALANSSANGFAAAPTFTANAVAGVYNVVASFSSLTAKILVTNEPVINSGAMTTFLTDLSNNFNFAQEGLVAPTFTSTGTLPPGVSLSAAGALTGDPLSGTGGVYPISITVNNGAALSATQTFNLTVVEKNALLPHPSLNTNGLGWALNGGASITNGAFFPTAGNSGEDRSIWFRYPLYLGAFQASFIYQDVSGNGADGVAFVMQNDTNGPAALGSAGGGLGYCGVTSSVALLMNIFYQAPGGVPSSVMLGTNGVGALDLAGAKSGRIYASTSPVNFDQGNPILVNLRYMEGSLQARFTDTSTAAVFETNYLVDIPAFIGTNSAFVGFSGSEGTVFSSQSITAFSFTPLPTLAANDVNHATVLSWPASVGGFLLQSTTNLSDAVWPALSGSISQSNGLNEAIVPSSAGPHFYRLILPP